MDLDCVRQLEAVDDTSNTKKNRISACANFRDLLWYWCEYYLRRGRDRLTLEFSTLIPFAVWKTTVAALCRDDGSDSSLVDAAGLHDYGNLSPYNWEPKGVSFNYFASSNDISSCSENLRAVRKDLSISSGSL
jgi:hypothetical protein